MNTQSLSGLWSRRVADHLWQVDDQLPSSRQVADLFHLSARTLARNLERERTSFRDLAIQVRMQRGQQMLMDEGKSVTQVALTLGYTDIANFCRSFKRCFGSSPTAYRRQAGAP